MTLDDGTEVAQGPVICNGVRLNVVQAGPEAGPAVILLHGFPEFWWGWRHQIGPLARAGFRVLVPDQRGYNTSDKPDGIRAYRIDRLAGDVTALAEACGHSRFHLVGHDWGGIVAFWLAAREPGRVRRLAILNAPHPDAIGPYLRRHPGQVLRSLYAAFFQLPHVPERALGARHHRALLRAMTGTARAQAFTEADFAHYRRAWAEPGALTAMLNWYRALVQLKRPAAGRILPRTLMIWGERDVALSRGLAEASLALCDQAEIVWRPNATHWVQHEDVAAVNEALIAHLREPAPD
jgi:pimeloyl-ACP methyl ester carboxylesterase